MAKLTRQAQQIFAGQAPSDMIAAFGSTQTGTPVYSTDLSTLQTTNYQQGWQDAIIADKAPFLEEMNGVQYGLSYQIAYAQQMGIPEWLNTQVYYTGSRCIASNYNVYKSLTDDNTGNNPVVDDGTNWVIDFPEEANVLNYVTNCIISAPNGVPSYSGTTVTVQEGTNYLFPNGRNSNNSVKNVNFSLASAATGTITGSTSATYCVFVTSELDLIFANNINYFITNTQPTALNDTTTAGVWFNPQTNLIYQCAATSSTPSWSTFEGAICATLTYDGSTITAFNPIYPVELLKRSDKEEITGWSMPDGSRAIDNIFNSTVTTTQQVYTAPCDGIVIVGSSATAIGIKVFARDKATGKAYTWTVIGLSSYYVLDKSWVLVGKNDEVVVQLQAASGSATINLSRFTPMKGANNV